MLEKEKIQEADQLTDEEIERIARELHSARTSVRTLDKLAEVQHKMDEQRKKEEEKLELEEVEMDLAIDEHTGLATPTVIDDLELDINLDNIADIEESDIKNIVIDEAAIKKSDIGKEISDEDAMKLLSFITKYEEDEKLNLYNEMPEFLRKKVNEMYLECGGQMSKPEISKLIVDNIIYEIKVDQAFFDLNEAIKNELKIPTMGEMYSEFMKETFEQKLIQQADAIREANPEKADLLVNISKTYSTTYTFERLIEGLNNRKVRQFIKDPSRFRKMCNNFNRKYINSRFTISNIMMCEPIIAKCIPELEDEYIKKFIMLFCKVCEDMNPDEVLDHVFMYYTIQNIRLLDHDKFENNFIDTRTEMYNTVVANIMKTVEEIKKRESTKVKK